MHAEVAASLHDLGMLSRTSRDYAAAESLPTRAGTAHRTLLGDEHEDAAATLVELGRLAEARREYDRAESLLRKTLAITRRDEAMFTLTSHSPR